MYRRWRRFGVTCFDHFSLMSFILLLAEHFPYTPCNFTLDCQKMDEPCGGLMDVGCWCLFGQCVTGDEGERKECSKTEDCTKMDKCASGHCYCSESNRAGNEPSRSLKFYNLFDCIYTLFQTHITDCKRFWRLWNLNLREGLFPALFLGELEHLRERMHDHQGLQGSLVWKSGLRGWLFARKKMHVRTTYTLIEVCFLNSM